ncbi:zinc finger protein RFP-like [Sceloporus undulatus]|uniref:zinc finger protein RFP-like n=1 Tax=Sceloporus undulatus TaxID=8520 RepID=UPI001C4AC183|nr:zinc finger protein RFP-like [Sceloporus undulatus]XP_042306688.1 zinc finger protein RFP-like [Sceloporus undulatus]XP_042306689.1 zinc finger protein RFP-like [Sceloporus undulatus]
MADVSAAGRDPIKDLCEEATCPVCLEYFKDPVTLECGHNFCQTCLSQCWKEFGSAEISCLQCKEKVLQRNLKPNRQLANMVEIAKELSFQGGRSQKTEEKGRVCEKHQEPLKLFCKDHEVSICLVCDRSKEHENHKVIPVDEASEEYKDRIRNLLETLEEEKENILAYKAETEQESQGLLEQTEREKEKIVAAFRQMHLEEQEKRLLAHMEEMEKEISAKGEDHLAILSEELSSLEGLIREMEEKHRQPEGELLQDIGSFLQGCAKKEKFENPVAFPPALKWKIWDFCDISPFLEGVMKQFKDSLESGLQQKKEKVTLDPETAHPRLILSEDHRTVTCGEKPQDCPDNPERFDKRLYVLGCVGFTGGRHFWEVTVGSEEEWGVGVARKTVRRKGSIPYSPESGIWDMGKWGNAYKASNPSDDLVLALKEEPKRIRVTLNCEGGRVAFYNADTADLIFEYPPDCFSGETLLPSFYVGQKAHLMISP